MDLQALERSLDEHPDDVVVRLAYADLLECEGREKEATFQRLLAQHRVWPQKDGHKVLPDGTWCLFSDRKQERPCHVGHIIERPCDYDTVLSVWKLPRTKWTRKELEEELRNWECWRRNVEARA